MSVFGDLSHGGQLESAVVTHLRTWLPSYLAECERQFDTTLASIASYSIVSGYDRLPQQAFPVLIVESPGPGKEIDRDGEGNVWARYEVQVTVATAAADPIPTRQQAQTYGIAVQALLTQKSLVADNVSVLDLTGIDFTAEPVEKRWRSSCTSTFLIEHRDFLNTDVGPTEPDLDPEDWPSVSEVITQIERTA